MQIGIVLHPYGEAAPAGLARIIFDLAAALIESDTENEYVLYLKEKPKVLPSFSKKGNWRIEIVGGGPLWREYGLRKAPPSDIYIFNTPVLPISWTPRRSIVLALDYAYWYFSPKTLWGIIKKRILLAYHTHSLKRASAIVSISEATRRDMTVLSRISPEKPVVVYPGIHSLCMETPKLLSERDLDGRKSRNNYFLFVGVIKERKNALAAVRAFDVFRSAHPADTHDFVIVGRRSGSYAQTIEKYIRSGGFEKRVLWRDHVSDTELAELYRGATALVFPSLLEGFGFPVVEAMSCGTPVITSDHSSLPEAAAGGALLVNPSDPSVIAEAMGRIAFEPSLREELRRRGFHAANRFNWSHAAREIRDVILRISKIKAA